MNQLSNILWLSVLLQVVAVILALRLISVSNKTLAWSALSLAFLLMTIRRSISLLHQEGYIQSHWLHTFSTETVALIISALIVFGVYMIKDIFLERNENEPRLRQVMAITGEGIWDWNVTSDRVSHNHRWCEILGLDDSYLHHTMQDFTALLYEDDRDMVIKNVQDCLQQKGVYRSEHRMFRADGSVIWVSDRGDVVERDIDGNPLRMLGSVSDITERKLAEQRLRAQAKIIDQIHDSVVSTDLDGVITSWNKGAERLFGYHGNEVLSKHISIVYPEEEHEFLLNNVIAPLQQQGVHEIEVKMRRKSGDDFYAHLSLSIQYDDLGIATGMIGYAIDNTEHRNAETALKQSEALLERAQEITQIGHWKLNPATGEVQGSIELFRIFGLSREEATLDSFVKIVHPDDRDMDLAAIQRGIDYGESWDITHRIICTDGEEKWVHAIGEAITENDNVVELLGTVQDITKHRKAEKEIEQSRVRFEAMFEAIPDAVVYADADRNIQLVNSAMIQLFGYKESECMGKQTRMLYASDADYQQQGERRFNPASTMDTLPYEIKYKKQNGNEFYGETLGTPVKSFDGEVLGYLGIIRDVSERREVDAILRSLAAGAAGLQFEQFLDDVLERLTELYGCKYALVGKLLPDGQHVQTLAVRANNKPSDNFVYQLKGTPCQDILDQKKKLIPEYASKIYTEDQMLMDMEVESYFGAPLIASDGSILGVLSVMDTSKLKLDEWTEPVLGVFANRVSTELERDFAVQELQQIKENLEDLVEERTYDLKATRDEAERANAAKSEFLSRMSHELRTPLNAILGFGQMLELDADGFSTTQREDVKEILEAGHHLLSLINEVLDLAKVESGNLELLMEDVSVDDMLQQCIPLIQTQAKLHELNLHNNLGNKGYIVKADFNRLKQVMLNLLSNAVKYNQKCGRITLDSKIIDKQRLRICVTDTGTGMTQEDVDKLFTPFQRLNAENNVEGTGIGLVITRHLIELMGGAIGVESLPGVGSTFWIELTLINTANS